MFVVFSIRQYIKPGKNFFSRNIFYNNIQMIYFLQNMLFTNVQPLLTTVANKIQDTLKNQ
jgi:hypothetical protein